MTTRLLSFWRRRIGQPLRRGRRLQFESLEDRSLLAVVADIVDIAPDPRNTAVGVVTINFSDAGAPAPVTGVGIGDFRLTRSGATVALTSLTVGGSGATYTLDLTTVTAPAGTYVLTLVAAGSGITDASGAALSANADDTWVTDLTAPTATIAAVTPSPRTTAAGVVTTTFSEVVSGVNISDFTLTRNGAPVSLAGLTVGGSGTSYTLDLSNVTSGFGAYTLTLVAVNSGIADLATNPLTTNASTSFQVDDRFEDNDFFGRPTELGRLSAPLTLNGLGLIDGNDWFRFTTSTVGSASTSVSIAFNNAQGNLDLELYSASGQRLAAATGFTNTELISLAGRAAGTYYVRVFGKSGAANPTYALTVSVPTILVDDAYEENDSRTTARDLGSPTTLLTIPRLVMADSNDWYRFRLLTTGAAADFAAINFVNSQGNLDLELYNSLGQLLVASTGTADSQQISLAGRAAGTYFLRVFGVGGATNRDYTLQLDGPAPTVVPDTTFNIQFLFNGLTTSQVSIFQQAAAKWQSIIVADLPAAFYTRAGFTSPYLVDDLLIDATAITIDGVGGVLGQSNNDAFRAGGGLPYHGNMQFDTADLAALEASGGLLAVVQHEIAHVLGFGTLWASRGLLTGSGTANVAYTGAQAVAAYNAVFGLTATSVPVENTGGAGTANSHWRESVLGNELMTGYYNAGVANPLSRITIAAMADLGYAVNFAAADPYVPPPAALVSGGTLLVSSTPASAGSSVLKLAPAVTSGSSPGGSPSSSRSTGVSLGPPPTLAGSTAASLKLLSPQVSPGAVDSLLANYALLAPQLKSRG